MCRRTIQFFSWFYWRKVSFTVIHVYTTWYFPAQHFRAKDWLYWVSVLLFSKRMLWAERPTVWSFLLACSPSHLHLPAVLMQQFLCCWFSCAAEQTQAKCLHAVLLSRLAEKQTASLSVCIFMHALAFTIVYLVCICQAACCIAWYIICHSHFVSLVLSSTKLLHICFYLSFTR